MEHLHFNRQRTTYVGQGVLTWHPQEGFDLKARVSTKESSNTPMKRVLRSIEIQRRTLVRLRLYDGGTRAVLPLGSVNELQLSDGILSEKFSRALFIQPALIRRRDSWRGEALFEYAEPMMLPDVVLVETKVRGTPLGEEHSLGGLYFKKQDGMSVIARTRKEQRLIEVSWVLPAAKWTKRSCWEYADGIRYALSVLSGQVIQMKYREVHRHGRIYQEIISNPAPFSLSVIFRLFDDWRLERGKVLYLADFFSRSNDRSNVARRILMQVAEASRQHTVAGRALLLSTILEAVLRTIYKKPFDPDQTKKSINIDYFLKKFRAEYLELEQHGKRWRRIINEVLDAYKRLRHRYAHPDWLSSPGGTLSREEMERTLNDLVLLSRFYGYIILGLAGIKVDEPVLPAPIKDWKPLVTVTKWGE